MEAEVTAIREMGRRWVDSVAASDVEQLGGLMTDDIVVIHGNGRVVAGREAVMADLASFFNGIRVRQSVQPEETIVAGDWAFDRARVHTTITARAGGERREVDSHTLTLLRKDGSGGWRVARVIGVVEQQERTE